MNSFRYKCEECLIVFEISAAPPTEWVEEMPDDTECGVPTCLDRCPWCGSKDVRLAHDVPANYGTSS